MADGLAASLVTLRQDTRVVTYADVHSRGDVYQKIEHGIELTIDGVVFWHSTGHDPMKAAELLPKINAALSNL